MRFEAWGATLDRDAPERVSGPVEVTGSVIFDNMDEPRGFPQTHGAIGRVLPAAAPRDGVLIWVESRRRRGRERRSSRL